MREGGGDCRTMPSPDAVQGGEIPARRHRLDRRHGLSGGVLRGAAGGCRCDLLRMSRLPEPGVTRQDLEALLSPLSRGRA